MKLKKRMAAILLPIMLVLGGTGCMNEKSPETAIVDYLEKTYHEKFEVEKFKKGSTFLKKMYGSDKIIAHPKGKPEYVFLAGEDRNHEGEYYDTYVLSKWEYELTKKFEKDIRQIVPGDFEYRVLLYVEKSKYDSSMKDMSVFDYFSKKNNDAEVVINIAAKSPNPPKPEEYYEPVYRLLHLLGKLGVEAYDVSIGFVDSKDDVTDYIRTASINNVPWSNLDAKVYGTIVVDNIANITDPSQIEEYYTKFED
ncbi:hypothetical protein [Neobacillus kokaensis]|uniref:Lipoprotein n=1 Tax=Neobacillus kokaensis TaxID=2759023 RepID=A0ABQ3N430_9BACI|nr:hypothetical protein [Neobacillus kokaensis]GHH98743.1 hypothetical protein AM1BK_22860 [Neobacillus kokaensis]